MRHLAAERSPAMRAYLIQILDVRNEFIADSLAAVCRFGGLLPR